MYLNTYLAVEYFSDVTGGHNCHLKVKYRGQFEVKHEINCTGLLCVFLYDSCTWESIGMTLEYDYISLEVVPNCH